MKVNLIDGLDLTAATVDVAAGVIRDVKLVGHRSKNRDAGKPRRYAAEALAGAVKLYEGVPVHVNHAMNAKGEYDFGRQRAAEDRLGIVENVKHVGGDEPANRGDIRLIKAHPMTARFLEAAADPKLARLFGLSHVAVGSGEVKGEEFVVDAIESVRSVDVVCDAATAKGFFEGVDETKPDPKPANSGGDTMELGLLTLDELRTKRPDLIEAIRDEIAPKADETKRKLAAAEAELDSYKTRVKFAEKKSRASVLCQKARLPADAITETFVETLCDAADDAAMVKLIEDRKAMIRGSGSRSKPQDYTEGDKGNYKSTVDMEAAVKAAACLVE